MRRGKNRLKDKRIGHRAAQKMDIEWEMALRYVDAYNLAASS
ncbi:hypothetical protein OK016_16915 [Vibrio chagasii]|nr:hypothetical protein [Vibrio chagasii]